MVEQLVKLIMTKEKSENLNNKLVYNFFKPLNLSLSFAHANFASFTFVVDQESQNAFRKIKHRK